MSISVQPSGTNGNVLLAKDSMNVLLQIGRVNLVKMQVSNRV